MIAGLVLAAGESRRMGRDKALLTYRGRTFLETILATLREAGVERIGVVLGHHAEEIQRAVNLENVRVVIHRDYALGQTSSLQAGLQGLDSPDVEAVVLCLVDQPLVSSATIRRLVETFRRTDAAVVIPTFQNQRGHPTVISRKLFAEIEVLGSGEGANAVIRRYGESAEFHEVEDRGVLLDIDDPETYRALT